MFWGVPYRGYPGRVAEIKVGMLGVAGGVLHRGQPGEAAGAKAGTSWEV